MKLHDLRPAEGAHKPRTRVGRGIAAGKGKTAGRGTKGQKARAGGSIPPWFEGGQTPLHMRIPKLRGFKNRGRVEFEVVNVGAINDLVERGAFETEAPKGAKAKAAASAQITINQDILRAVGLVRTLNKPLKILGGGELTAAAVRRRRCVHRVRPDEDRVGRRRRQRPRGPDHGHAGAQGRPSRGRRDPCRGSGGDDPEGREAAEGRQGAEGPEGRRDRARGGRGARRRRGDRPRPRLRSSRPLTRRPRPRVLPPWRPSRPTRPSRHPATTPSPCSTLC